MSRLKICLFIKNWIKNILNDMKTILLIDVKIYFFFFAFSWTETKLRAISTEPS